MEPSSSRVAVCLAYARAGRKLSTRGIALSSRTPLPDTTHLARRRYLRGGASADCAYDPAETHPHRSPVHITGQSRHLRCVDPGDSYRIRTGKAHAEQTAGGHHAGGRVGHPEQSARSLRTSAPNRCGQPSRNGLLLIMCQLVVREQSSAGTGEGERHGNYAM
jgi:hypothetical protein